MHLVPRIMQMMRESELDDVVVFAGGIIPDADIAKLKEIGIAEVFPPGSSLEEITEFVRSRVRKA
jgi:methylmalonyl-CoA mutase C-terminal domain/subunit